MNRGKRYVRSGYHSHYTYRGGGTNPRFHHNNRHSPTVPYVYKTRRASPHKFGHYDRYQRRGRPYGRYEGRTRGEDLELELEEQFSNHEMYKRSRSRSVSSFSISEEGEVDRESRRDDRSRSRHDRIRNTSQERQSSGHRYHDRKRFQEDYDYGSKHPNKYYKNRYSDHYHQDDDLVDDDVDVDDTDLVTDLREIIKHREETRSQGHRSENGEIFNEMDEHEGHLKTHDNSERKKSRWGNNEEKKEGWNLITNTIVNDQVLSATKETGSSSDSNPDIPYFDGTDENLTPTQFVKLVEAYGEQCRWTEDDVKCQMAAKLKGAVREWFLKDELMTEPWEKIKVQFVRMHPTDMDYHQRLQKMMERTKFENESMSNYFTYKALLISAVDIHGRRAVSCLIGGLMDPQLRRICYENNFANTDDLFAFLSNEENASKQGSMEGANQFREPSLNKLLRDDDEAYRQDDMLKMTQPIYEPKYLLSVRMRKHKLEGYNDPLAHGVTVTEAAADELQLDYYRRRTTIIGCRGVPVMALGDCDLRVSVDQATVHTKIFIVPNISQDKAVVIGRAFREHEQIVYEETETTVTFKEHGRDKQHKEKSYVTSN